MKVLEICFAEHHLKINPVFTVSTEVWELAAPEGPEPIFAGEASFFGRTANREHGWRPVSVLMSLARLEGN